MKIITRPLGGGKLIDVKAHHEGASITETLNKTEMVSFTIELLDAALDCVYAQIYDSPEMEEAHDSLIDVKSKIEELL